MNDFICQCRASRNSGSLWYISSLVWALMRVLRYKEICLFSFLTALHAEIWIEQFFYELKRFSFLYKVTPYTEIHLLLTRTSSFWPHKLCRFKIYHPINTNIMSLAKSSVPLLESIRIWTSFFIRFSFTVYFIQNESWGFHWLYWHQIVSEVIYSPRSHFIKPWIPPVVSKVSEPAWDLCDELSLSKPASSVDCSRFCLVDLTVFPVTVALVCVVCMKSLMALNISKLSNKTNPPDLQYCWQISSPVIKPQGPFKLYMTVLSLQILYVFKSVGK